MMHDGLQYGSIQGQGQGHAIFKVANPAIFKSSHLPSTIGAGNWPRILKLWHNA